MAGFPKETITEGLDGLRERLKEYAGLGARFAKWRAVIRIEGDLPSSFCVHANAHALARYAALCQEAGIVPIVEPEVLMDGDHTLARCEEVTTAVLERTFVELRHHRVAFEGMVLKPNMIVPARTLAAASVEEWPAPCAVSGAVPATVPGIAFLSGGQSARFDRPPERHNALGRCRGSSQLLRPCLAPSLKAWGGKPDRFEAGQDAF